MKTSAKHPALGETEFWLLVALSEEPRHGYAIAERVRELSDGEVELRIPTLYSALDRLEQAESVALDRDEIVNGRLRRYFRITGPGGTRLAEEIARLERKASLASRVIDRLMPGSRAHQGGVT